MIYKTRQIIIVVFLIYILIECKENSNSERVNKENVKKENVAPYNTTDIGDGVKYNYDTLSADYIKKVKTSLLNKNFKFLDEQKFKDKVFEVFNINVYDYKNKIVVLRPAMFTEIAIKEDKFILIENPETDNSKDAINDDLEYYYNSYVFYGDKIAFNWLKSRNKQQLIDLVVQYGYDSDKELIKFVFKDFDFDDSVLFHDLIFTNNVKTKKFVLRESILNDIESLVYKGTIEGYTEAKEGNGYNSFSEIIQKLERTRIIILIRKNILLFYMKKI